MAIDAGVYIAPVTINAHPPLRVAAEVNATGLLCEVALISSLAFSGQSTRNPPLRVMISEPILTDCLRFQRPRRSSSASRW